jgi:predicted nucleotidyltransferase
MAPNFETVREEARRYANEARLQLPIYRVYLFGSYAKGTADALSDVDICFFLHDYQGKRRVDMIANLLRIAGNYKAYFEPIVLPSSELSNGNPFAMEIINTGIEI